MIFLWPFDVVIGLEEVSHCIALARKQFQVESQQGHLYPGDWGWQIILAGLATLIPRPNLAKDQGLIWQQSQRFLWEGICSLCFDQTDKRGWDILVKDEEGHTHSVSMWLNAILLTQKSNKDHIVDGVYPGPWVLGSFFTCSQFPKEPLSKKFAVYILLVSLPQLPWTWVSLAEPAWLWDSQNRKGLRAVLVVPASTKLSQTRESCILRCIIVASITL